jgi:hypothetical protein
MATVASRPVVDCPLCEKAYPSTCQCRGPDKDAWDRLDSGTVAGFTPPWHPTVSLPKGNVVWTAQQLATVCDSATIARSFGLR